jgi:hypothetical protein
MANQFDLLKFLVGNKVRVKIKNVDMENAQIPLQTTNTVFVTKAKQAYFVRGPMPFSQKSKSLLTKTYRS